MKNTILISKMIEIIEEPNEIRHIQNIYFLFFRKINKLKYQS